MASTSLMDADELAHTFNAVRERQYWTAVVGGTRTLPTIIFKSRSAMVELTYYTESKTFAVSFTKATCSFGDFMASTYKSLVAVLTAFKAAGLDTAAPVEGDEGVLRVEYDPKTKTAYVSLARMDDEWQDYAPKLAPQADIAAMARSIAGGVEPAVGGDVVEIHDGDGST